MATPDPKLYLFIPYHLDERGKCCKSRVVSAGSSDVRRVRAYFKKQLGIITSETNDILRGGHPGALGVMTLYYEWNPKAKQYDLEEASSTIHGSSTLEPKLAAEFERFAETIQYYERLDARGRPFPGDPPIIHAPEPPEPRTRGRHHIKRPTLRQRRQRWAIQFNGPTGKLPRVEKSYNELPSPLFPNRSQPTIAFPPRGCHPFVRHAITTELATKVPKHIRQKGLHSYFLCDFGDVPRATREKNFLALKRRKGIVVGIYKFYRVPFGIVTDMRDGIAHVADLSEM